MRSVELICSGAVITSTTVVNIWNRYFISNNYCKDLSTVRVCILEIKSAEFENKVKRRALRVPYME